MLRTSLWLLGAALCCRPAVAAGLQIGYYASPQGASLIVDRDADRSFHLVAYSGSSLAQRCVVDAEAVYRKGTREQADFAWNGCRYRVAATQGTIPVIRLHAETPSCNAACARKLFLTGQAFTYQYPGCAARQIEQRRDEFQRQLSDKRFHEAYTTLAYTFEHCLGYVETVQRAWVYADLAMAALKKGDPKRCLELLDGYTGANRAPNERVAQAIEINRKLCQEAGPAA